MDVIGVIDWTTIGVIASMVAVIIALVSLILTWVHNRANNKYNRSLFYLKQVEDQLNSIVFILENCGNNNIKWHQAIMSLKLADHLMHKITNEDHQSIYVAKYLNVTYEIMKIVAKINDFKFFYGIERYQGRHSIRLYNASSINLGQHCSRISPEDLLCLCLVVDKVQRAYYDATQNRIEYNQIFHKPYFNKSLDAHNISLQNLTEFTKIEMKIILEYILDYKSHSESSVTR